MFYPCAVDIDIDVDRFRDYNCGNNVTAEDDAVK